MIQRIQTLYFFLAAVVAGLYLYTPIIAFEYKGVTELLRAYEMKYFYEGYLIFVVLIAGCISVGSNLIAVLLFKKYSLQKFFAGLSIVSMLFCFGYVLFKWYFTDYIEDTVFYYGNITPWVVVLLNILALRGVAKDESLIKSYDRLR